jgi:hypothetical protein
MDLYGPGQELVTCICEDGNEHLGHTNGGEFFNQLRDCYFLKAEFCVIESICLKMTRLCVFVM